MRAKLDQMPLLVWDSILREVCSDSRTLVNSIANTPQIHDTSYWTLQDIVLVNKRCYLAAAPILYRNLSLHVSSPEELEEHCSRIGPGRINHTRCLKLWGRMPFLPGENHFYQDDEDYPEEHHAQFDVNSYIGYSDGLEEEVIKCWEPLVVMIEHVFRHISDFIWVCRNQFPSCLLRGLEQHHPNCRLHIRTFSLRGLQFLEAEMNAVAIDHDGDFAKEDSHEQQLISSPLLHSITVRMVGLHSDTNLDDNQEAIFHVAARAPNLRHLNIIKCEPQFNSKLFYLEQEARDRRRRGLEPGLPRLPWKPIDKVLFPNANKAKGKLISLMLVGHDGYRSVSLEGLTTWFRCIDSSHIRHLGLGVIEDPRILGYLLSKEVKFTFLEMLEIQPAEPLTAMLASLMDHLQPLKDNRFTGEGLSKPSFPLSLLNKVLQRHGPTLRRLTLNRAIGSEGIRLLESLCSRLEYLNVILLGTAIYIKPSRTHKLSRICPNISSLQELNLRARYFPGRCISSEPDSVIRSICQMIDSEKRGLPLKRLCMRGFDVSPIILQTLFPFSSFS